MGMKVGHIEIIGKDGKKLQDFYGKLFDWKVDTNNPQNYGVVTPEDAGVSVGIGPAMPNMSGYVAFYVAVDDLDAALKKAVKLGGKVVMEPMEVMGGPKIAMFTDPEGNLVGLLIPQPMP